MRRRIQAPGIEINEIDRSRYDDTADNSIVGTTSLIMGFADNGSEYTVNHITQMKNFTDIYGKPQNEAERYFYNATQEIMDRGGRAYVARLPYDCSAHNKYSFTTYQVGDYYPIPLSSPYDVLLNDIVEDEAVHQQINLYTFYLMPNIDIGYLATIDTENGNDGELDLLRNEIETLGYIFFDGTENQKVNFCAFCDKYGVNLTIIDELFEYILQQTNVRYYDYEVIEYIFGEDDVRFKNTSVYILKEMMSDIEAFKEKYVTSKSELDEETKERYRTQLDSLYSTFARYGNYEGLVEQFGKYNTLVYYRDYLKYLVKSFENLTCSEEDELLRVSLIGFMQEFDKPMLSLEYTPLKQINNDITSYIGISSLGMQKGNSGLMDINIIDKLITNEQNVEKNQIVFVEMEKHVYGVDDYRNQNFEYVGIAPIITTPANALYFRDIIKTDISEQTQYVTTCGIQNTWSSLSDNMMSCMDNAVDQVTQRKLAGFVMDFGNENDNLSCSETISKTSTEYFPEFVMNEGRLNMDDMKKIGVVVYQMYVDSSSYGRIKMIPVESFVGTLNRYSTDKDTGKSTFIDNVINGGSTLIKCFSNVEHSPNELTRKFPADFASTYVIKNQVMTSLGIYASDNEKKIGLHVSIVDAIDRIFANINDPNRHQIDIVVDAGIANIAQFVDSVYKDDARGYYDITGQNAYLFNMNDEKNTRTWRRIISKYDNFCKNVRKDCMFVADGMRPLCLTGNEKRVRYTNTSNTVKNTVLKDITKMSGYINSSYGAGYCDWFYTTDASSGEYFWCPPSIKAAGVYTYTDAYFSYWMAPAGLNRGRLPEDVIDVAFSPTIDEAGVIYNANWNYAVNYPIDGIVIEGQRTFQKNKTALDRVNVRRLMIGLEKQVRYVAKFFVYEGITNYLMQRFTDSIDYILKYTKDKNGISDYYIVCDSRNNNTQTIDNNELHCTIAIKPIKALEFIVMNFICTNQSANVQEIAESEM